MKHSPGGTSKDLFAVVPKEHHRHDRSFASCLVLVVTCAIQIERTLAHFQFGSRACAPQIN